MRHGFGSVGHDVYVDGEWADCLGSASGWDAAATFIEKHTPANTTLRRFAEEGQTDQPQLACAMLVTLLQCHQAAPDIRHTLTLLHRCLLKSQRHVMIPDGVTYKN